MRGHGSELGPFAWAGHSGRSAARRPLASPLKPLRIALDPLRPECQVEALLPASRSKKNSQEPVVTGYGSSGPAGRR
jgi:hypothetical protein